MMNSVTTVNCALAAAHIPECGSACRIRCFCRAAIGAAHCKRIPIQDKSPGWIAASLGPGLGFPAAVAAKVAAARLTACQRADLAAMECGA